MENGKRPDIKKLLGKIESLTLRVGTAAALAWALATGGAVKANDPGEELRCLAIAAFVDSDHRLHADAVTNWELTHRGQEGVDFVVQYFPPNGSVVEPHSVTEVIAKVTTPDGGGASCPSGIAIADAQSTFLPLVSR